MEIGIFEILGGLALLLIVSYYYLTSTFDFWTSRGIPGPKPSLIYGNIKQIMFGKMSLGMFIKQEYEKYKEQPMFGIFLGRMPVLIINDPKIIKKVLIKDFWSFANRGIRIFEKVEPLSQNLVNLESARWKPLRAKQTVMFTSNKLKGMFHILLECANNLDKILMKMTAENDVIECCELNARYSTDVIGASAFGIDMKALEDENSQFRKVGKKFIHADKWRSFKMRFKQMFPFLYNLLCPIMYDHEINDFFIKTIIETMEYRKKNNIVRGDFVDLLIDLKSNPDKLEGIDLTDTLLTAQAFVFFFAGFDTSSLTMSHALYELALNQSIQDKLREEINNELKENDGKLEYDRVKNMKYLRMVFSETLRKYPVTVILTRQAMHSYRFEENNLIIPRDTRVWVPVYGIHRDPKLYPNPETFDPERFADNNIRDVHSSFYLPFGAGPRNCIGATFGTFQTKIGLITILRNYKVDVCDKTTIPYEIDARRFLLGPAKGIFLKFTKIN